MAVQGAQGHVACRWRERVKRKVVLGESVRRKLLPMGAGRMESLHSIEAVGANAQPMGGSAILHLQALDPLSGEPGLV